MTHSTAEKSQLVYARVAGVMYLFVLATAVFGFYIRAGLIVSGDAAATANNIMASEGLFRIGIASDLIAFTGIVLLALALYVVLKPVNKNLALLALFWWLGEAAVLGITTLNSFFVLSLLSGADYLTVFETSQLQALVRLFFIAYFYGYIIGLIFFSLGSTVFAYLLFKSHYVPRILAGWGIFSSLVVLLGTFAIVLYPYYAAFLQPGFGTPIFFYELILGFWLLIKGVNVGRV